jgi:hypothetical protein
MKKLILAALTCVVVMFSLNSCGGKLSAVDYNERIVNIQESSVDYFQIVLSKATDSSLSDEEKQVLADSISIKSNEWYNQVNALKYPDAAKDFQASALKLFEFQKDSVTPVLQKLILSKDENEYNSIIDTFNDLVDRSNEINDEMTTAQEEFAKKVGMGFR